MEGIILLVEDERSLLSSLKTELQFENYQVLEAKDGLQAVEVFNDYSSEIDLIILDWMLPKLDGLGVMRRIRANSDVPIIMLTARDYVGDKVMGFKSGADDYVTKPFDIEELLVRIASVLKRTRKNENKRYSVQDLVLDKDLHQVFRNNKIIQLTQREFKLLTFLFENVGKICSRNELLDHVWGVDFDGQPNIVDVYIRLLRNKIDKEYDNKLIHTVRGIGYMLKG